MYPPEHKSQDATQANAVMYALFSLEKQMARRWVSPRIVSPPSSTDLDGEPPKDACRRTNLHVFYQDKPQDQIRNLAS